MTNTATEAPIQAAPNAAVPADVENVLDSARDTIDRIEGEVDRLNDLMVEFCLLDFDPSGEGLVEECVDDLGAAANELFNILNRRFEMLRREVTTAGDDDGD